MGTKGENAELGKRGIAGSRTGSLYLGLCAVESSGYEWITPDAVDIEHGYRDGAPGLRYYSDQRGRPSFGGGVGLWPAYSPATPVDTPDRMGPFLVACDIAGPMERTHFDPMASRSLVQDFLLIREAANDDAALRRSILRFANSYGLLGFRQLWSPDHGPAESLASWHIEVFKFGLCRDLAKVLLQTTAKETANLSAIFRPIIDQRPGCYEPRTPPPYPLRDFNPHFDWGSSFGQLPDTSIRVEASRFVIAMLNFQINMHVSPVLDIRPGRPMLLVPRNLLGALYLSLAMKLNHGKTAEVRTCENPECGTPITSGRKRRFCTRPCRDRYDYLRDTGQLPNDTPGQT